MERAILLIVDLLFGIPGIILSIVLLSGRGAGMLAGYNTMPVHQKRRWDEKKLCRATGIILLLFVLCLFVGVLLLSYNFMLAFWLLVGFGTAQLLAGVIYINCSKRFRK